jgi:Ca-activated chloride channel family protein
LKKLAAICICLAILSSSRGQYYLRGEIKDESNNPLPNVKLILASSGYVYYTGNAGAFGIPIPKLVDSVTVLADGFQTYSTKLNAGTYQYITLKVLHKQHGKAPGNHLMSFTKNLKPDDWHGWTVAAETYSSLIENDFVSSEKFPETGLTININKASYSNVRRFLNMETYVPPDAVRIEELLNNFNFAYSEPSKDSSFAFGSYLTDCPWDRENQLLYLNVSAKKANIDKIPPSNLVFLIDVSGSMDLPNRLPLLKSAFKILVQNLRSQDTVSIVVYGGMVGVWLGPTSGGEKKKILKYIDSLEPGGPTPGEAGIRAAYRLAKSQYITGGNNRVILATDGDFNVGENSEDDLERLILMHKQWGIYLTCLGVGMGNYKDSKLEVLAKKGNGNFAYLDDEKEAEKVLMNEFAQTIYAVADNAHLDVKFNPDIVKQYRLIGFENKLMALTDSSSEIEGGEVGSGQSLLVMFEIKPASQDKQNADPGKKGFAKLVLHYRNPNDSVNRRSYYDCPHAFTKFSELPSSYRFATSTVIFGELLKKSKFMSGMSWEDAEEIANQSVDRNDTAQMEFIQLIEKARKLYSKDKKKKKKKEPE